MEQPGARLAQGIQNYNEGRFAKAESAFAAAIAEDDAAPDAWILKAFCRQALGDAAGARREIEKTLKRFPASTKAHAQCGQLCVQQGRLNQALALARRAERLDREYLPAYRQQAFALTALGRLREALNALRRALRATPQNAEVWCETALAHIQLREWRDALGCAREALRLDPKSPQAGKLEATALMNLGRPGDALTALRGTRRAAPRSAAVWCETALAYNQLREWREALRCARRALRLDPKSARAGKLEAAALANVGRPEDVLASLRRALRASPGDAELWVSMAIVQAGLGSDRRARAALLQASKHGLTEAALRGVIPSLTDKAEALRDKGWFAQADRLMRLALECAPGDPELWFKQGVLLRHRNRLAEADAAYLKSCELRPGRLQAYLYRAETLMAMGRVDEVFRVLREAQSLCPLPDRQDFEGRLQRYRLSASLFDFAAAARIGEAVLKESRRLRHIEGLCWPILVDDFELVVRPPDFLRRAESALDGLARSGKAALWGRLLCAGFALQPGGTPSFRSRALAESAPLMRLPRSRYGWMRYVTGCLRKVLGHREAALADFRASSRTTRPANWLALFHENEILLSQGKRAAALRGLKRVELLVPENRSRDFLIKKGWFLLEAGRLADARQAFERVTAGAHAPDAELGLRAIRERRA